MAIHKLPELIAEIGVNYYDIAEKLCIKPIEAAMAMIHAAKASNVDIVKFQTYKSEKLAAVNSPAYWELSEEPTASQKELFSKYDKFDIEDYRMLAQECGRIGVEFMTTPFDAESAESINPLVKRHKVASADITNIELLSLIGSFGKPVLLSTGASTKEEIQNAVDILKRAGTLEITLLHCVLNYPTLLEKAKLWKIKALKKEFPGETIGYSDHTKFNANVLSTAWLLGAEVIEKHFTLDKTLRGNDHYHAASPEDFKELFKHLNDLRATIGEEKSGWYDSSEEASRKFARRGVYLVRDVHVGEYIRKDDVVFLRPQNNGITPLEWEERLLRHEKYDKDMEKGDLII